MSTCEFQVIFRCTFHEGVFENCNSNLIRVMAKIFVAFAWFHKTLNYVNHKKNTMLLPPIDAHREKKKFSQKCSFSLVRWQLFVASVSQYLQSQSSPHQKHMLYNQKNPEPQKKIPKCFVNLKCSTERTQPCHSCQNQKKHLQTTEE